MVRDVAARVRVACAESGARRSTGPGSASGQGVRALALFNVGTQICLKWQVLRRTFYQTCNESRVAVEGRGLERYAYGLRSMSNHVHTARRTARRTWWSRRTVCRSRTARIPIRTPSAHGVHNLPRERLSLAPPQTRSRSTVD